MSESTENDNEGYRVLARKYRPSNFDELIGQETCPDLIQRAFHGASCPCVYPDRLAWDWQDHNRTDHCPRLKLYGH